MLPRIILNFRILLAICLVYVLLQVSWCIEDIKCPRQYSPLCACTPDKAYKTMTFHNECFLRKHISKHRNNYTCRLHDGICNEDDRQCATLISRYGGLDCRPLVTSKSRPHQKVTKKPLSRLLPVFYPRGSVPH